MPKPNEASSGNRPPGEHGHTEDDSGILGIRAETGCVEQSVDNEASDRPTKRPGRPLKGLLRGTYSLHPENKQWVKTEAARRLTTESAIVDGLITEKRQEQSTDEVMKVLS